MKKYRIVAALLAGALVISVALNLVIYDKGRDFYLRLNEVKLDPLDLDSFAGGETPPPPAPGQARVVLLGDSRVEDWPLPGGPPGFQFVNRGVGDQTTAQIVARFEAHVAPLAPQVVVVQAGINDLKAIPLFPERRAAIVAGCQANLAQIVARSKALGATVVVTTLFPLGRVPLERRLFWSEEVGAAMEEVNDYLRSLEGDGIVVVDTTPILADEDGRMRRAYGRDLLHLTPAGYEALNGALVKVLASMEP
jgi:lysophospholipase L1-like esterase